MAKEVAFDREKYSAAVDKYRREPSLENYIDLRRFPGSIGVGITAFPSGDVLLEMTDDSRMAGIPPEALLNVVACDKYDEEAIDTLSLWTIEALVKRRKLERAGKTHLQSRREAISDELVNYLILVMLDIAHSYNEGLPTSLNILIRDQLGGAHSARLQNYEKQRKRNLAAFYGFLLLRKGQALSIRRVAKKMGVQPSTVLRWFPNNSFHSEVERWRRKFEPSSEKARRSTDA